MTGIHVKQRIDEAFNEIEKAVESGNMSFENLKSNTISMDALMRLAANVGVLDQNDLVRYRVLIKALISKFIDNRSKKCEVDHDHIKDVNTLHEYVINREEDRQRLFKAFHFKLAAFRMAKRALLSGCETIRGEDLQPIADGLYRSLWMMINEAYMGGLIGDPERIRMRAQVAQVLKMEAIHHA